MLIDYRWLQSGTSLKKLERKNFLEEPAKMQWWYCDVVMSDGSTLLLAFVPKKWWPDVTGANLGDALVMVAMLGADRKLRSASRTLDASIVRSSDDGLRLEVPGGMSITRSREDPATYRFTFDMPDAKGTLEIRSVAKPFSAFPGGKLPGLGRKALLGGKLGTEAFSYISQVPRGTASGEITFGSERIVIDGHAYHEQGRFDDVPERLSRKGWFWVHFLHSEWNIFGSPGVFLYVQERQDRPIFHGLNLFERELGFKNRTLGGDPAHHQVFEGGEMRFAYGGLKLSIKADPERGMPLISFPSANTKQIYHTLVTDAELTVERAGKTSSFAGQMILESCWIGL